MKELVLCWELCEYQCVAGRGAQAGQQQKHRWHHGLRTNSLLESVLLPRHSPNQPPYQVPGDSVLPCAQQVLSGNCQSARSWPWTSLRILELIGISFCFNLECKVLSYSNSLVHGAVPEPSHFRYLRILSYLIPYSQSSPHHGQPF